MRRLLPFVLISSAALAFLAKPAGAQGASAPIVDLIKVDGAIDQPVLDYIVGSIDRAEADRSIVVLQLDSPGTMGIDHEALLERVEASTTPVVAWVGPVGAVAQGTALRLLGVDDISVASPGVGIGPGRPEDLLHDERVAERGPDPLDRGPLTAQEALDLGIVDLASGELTDLDAIMREIDGTAVQTSTGEVVLETWDEDRDLPRQIRFHDLGPGRRFLHAIASPGAIWLLLILGFALIAFELTQSGIGVAGVSGALMVAAAVYGIVVVPPNWLGLAIFVAGHVLMIWDVVKRRLGPMSYAGAAGFLAGSILMYSGVADAVDISPWMIGFATLGAILYYFFGLTVAIQSRERMTAPRRGLVGLVGETRSALAPEGPVYVKGALWRGRAMDGPIAAGTRVRVRGVDGLILQVQPEPEADLPDEPPAG